ncbi:hypothetical protein Lal_00027987 [Lupinus albus]|nr:hypothetical protein Lal_00027987 [Lupinus albus]
MNSSKPIIPWNFLEESITTTPPTTSIHKKSFTQALKNSCDVPISQLPQPCIKGDVIAIKIREEEYQAGLQRCKTHLHGTKMKKLFLKCWTLLGRKEIDERR